MDNVELVKQGYRNFSTGNIEAVLANFHPEIVWEESTGFPYISGDGISHGPQEILKNIFTPLPEHIDSFHIDIKELFGCKDKVVMMGHYTGTWIATGKKFRVNASHIWTINDGKITHMFQAADTAEMIGA